MLRARLVVTRRMPDLVEARINRDYDARLNLSDTQYAEPQWLERCTNAAGIFCTGTDRLSADLISRLPESIRIIATFSVGYDHIDVARANARGIVVTNTPGIPTNATADIALLLLLGAARRASEGEAMMRARTWTGWGPGQLLGTHVTGKSLGIVGMGRIGMAVARRAAAFDMPIHYLSRSPKDVPGVPDAHHHAGEDGFWSKCEFLSMHLPANPETRGFLNAARIAKLPHGAIVINTARGEVVDDDALIAGLKSGQIGAAGLDVFTGEPHFREEYATQPSTFLLPHLGSATVEIRCEMGYRVLDNFDDFFAGKLPRDTVITG